MKKVLVIDDDIGMRSSVAQTLSRAGYAVREAGDGHEGMRLHEADPADLIVSDVVMPEKDGLEVMMQVKKTSPNTKLIVISGGGRLSSSEYLPLALKLGANGTLEKPFRRDQLLALVREVLGPASESAPPNG